MIGRTYSIIRSSRRDRKTVKTVVKTGLSWDVADNKRNTLDEAERAKNPLKRSWSRVLHILQLEPL